MHWRLLSGAAYARLVVDMIQCLLKVADNNGVRRDVGWVVPSPLLMFCLHQVCYLRSYRKVFAHVLDTWIELGISTSMYLLLM